MFRFYLFKYGLYAFIFAMIGASAYFNSKIIEAIFLFIAYIVMRYAFPKTWHSKSFYVCIFFSILTFWIAIPLTIPINISLFSCVIVGSLIGLILYHIKEYADSRILSLNQKIEIVAFKRKIKDLLSKNDDPLTVLLELCKKHELSERDTKIAIKYYIDRFKPKQIWMWCLDNNENIEYDSVRQLLWRINKKLYNKTTL